MKRLLIYTLTALVCGSVLISLIRADGGYILISIGNFTIESRFWVGIFILLLIVLIVYQGLKFIVRSVRGVKGGFALFGESRDRSAIRRTNRGLVHFIDGNWSAAKRDLLSAARRTENPLVHYLAAARSAHELGLEDETRFLLEQAHKISPEHAVTIAISQARIYLSSNQYEKALATLESVKQHARYYPAIYDLLCEIYKQLQDWPQLVAILPEMEKAEVMSDEDFQSLCMNGYLSLFNYAHKHLADEEQISAIKDDWKHTPKTMQKASRIVGAYASRLIQLNKEDDAANVLRQALKQTWHFGLIDLYSELQTIDKKSKLDFIEKQVKAHKDEYRLLYLAGKVSLENELWGKARSYFEESIRVHPMIKSYAALAQLYAQLGELEESASCYQKGLEFAAR